jgi:hypothetical protein
MRGRKHRMPVERVSEKATALPVRDCGEHEGIRYGRMPGWH